MMKCPSCGRESEDQFQLGDDLACWDLRIKLVRYPKIRLQELVAMLPNPTLRQIRSEVDKIIAARNKEEKANA